MEINEHVVVDLYLRGESLNSIAKVYRTYPITISRILTKHNIDLRHDAKRKGSLYVKDGEKLLRWARKQGRLVTRQELAKVIGTKRLSTSYFDKYPELSQYVETRAQKELKGYYTKLYDWLNENRIPYKPNDRTILGGTSVDAVLIGKYYGVALQIIEKPTYVSRKAHTAKMTEKSQKAADAGIMIIFLTKDHFKDLSKVKELIDSCLTLRKDIY